MKKKIFFVVLLTFFFIPTVFASKESSVRKGNQLYKKGDYALSLKNYENAFKAAPESPEVNFNLGTALYKNKKYSDAVEHLQKSLLSSDKTVQKNAHFNLGNALFEAGLGIKDKALDQAIKSLEESLRQFDTVMNLDDKDVDAKYNHDIVQKELERLKKKQEQQKQQSQRSKQDDGQKQDQQQQDQQKQDQKKDSSKLNSEQKDQDQQQAQSPEDKDEDNNKKPSFKPEDQQVQDQSHDDKKSESSSREEPAAGEMTKEEAKDLLKQFEQNEQPAGLLNFDRKRSEERPVLKDW